MDIIRVTVNKVPENCEQCIFREYVPFEHTGAGFSLCILKRQADNSFVVIENLDERLSECPLVLVDDPQ